MLVSVLVLNIRYPTRSLRSHHAIMFTLEINLVFPPAHALCITIMHLCNSKLIRRTQWLPVNILPRFVSLTDIGFGLLETSPLWYMQWRI